MFSDISAFIDMVGGGMAVAFLAGAIASDLIWPHIPRRHYMMSMQSLTAICWGGHFYALGAMTGVGVNVLLALQALAAIHVQRTSNRIVISMVPVLAIPVLAITWDGWHSILPIIATLGLTMARLQSDRVKVTACCLFLCIVPFSIYAITIHSPLLVVCNIFVGISTSLSFMKMLREVRLESKAPALGIA